MLLEITNDDFESKLMLGVIVVLATIIGNYILERFKSTLEIRKNKRDENYKKLNEFYGPFQQYLNTSGVLYDILKKNKPKEFRTLTHLLEPSQVYTFDDGSKGVVTLNASDKAILTEILELGSKMEALIIDKAGLVDNEELRFKYSPATADTDVQLSSNGLLALAKAHFQVIRLANEGKLAGEAKRFENYVFPRALPGKIEIEIQKLKAELIELNS